MNVYWKYAEDLELTPVDDGFIAYDDARDRVHHLNHEAALVFVLCNGQSTADDISHLIQEQFHLPQPPRQEVDEILARFVDEGLARALQQPATTTA